MIFDKKELVFLVIVQRQVNKLQKTFSTPYIVSVCCREPVIEVVTSIHLPYRFFILK